MEEFENLNQQLDDNFLNNANVNNNNDHVNLENLNDAEGINDRRQREMRNLGIGLIKE